MRKMPKVTDSDDGGREQCVPMPNAPQHTRDHRNCPICQGELESSLHLSPDLTFAEAFDLWIKDRNLDPAADPLDIDAPRFISPRTEQDLRQYAREAGRFFGRLPLSEIHLGHFKVYQRARAACDQRVAGWTHRAGANLLRKEVQTVMRVMRAAGLWTEELSNGLLLVRAAQSGVAPAITAQEQERLLASAARLQECRVVYWFALLTLRTTASTDELRGLRLEDATQGDAACIRVYGKNRFRERTIPVTSQKARWALDCLVRRARELGATRGSDYLFPLHVAADRYDPRRPMTAWGLRKRWETVRDDAGLRDMRLYGLRHAALTRMAEAGAPIHVMMAFAGHMSVRMQRHYVAISMASKREWAERIWGADEDDLPPKKPAASVGVNAARIRNVTPS